MRVPTGLTGAKLAPVTGLHATGGTEDGQRCITGGSLKQRLVDDHRQ